LKKKTLIGLLILVLLM